MANTMNLVDPPLPIAFRGYFDLEKIYKTSLNWFVAQQMIYQEPLFKTKPTEGGTREYEIQMAGTVKLDVFHLWKASVVIKVWDGMMVELETQQGKVNQMRGRILITITGSIDRDWQGMYTGTTIKEKMLMVILKMRRWEEAFDQWDPYYYKLVGLHNTLKEQLGMVTAKSVYG